MFFFEYVTIFIVIVNITVKIINHVFSLQKNLLFPLFSLTDFSFENL